ncbi:hypothetical protein CaCOL14_005607 [Colletotrichum acutatum]
MAWLISNLLGVINEIQDPYDSLTAVRDTLGNRESSASERMTISLFI